MPLTIKEFKTALMEDLKKMWALPPEKQWYGKSTLELAEVVVMNGQDPEQLIQRLLKEVPEFWHEPGLYHTAGLPCKNWEATDTGWRKVG